MKCTVCSSASKPLFSGRILGRYDIQYYLCPNCDFVQTEPPYWLSEAYHDSIAQTDIGLIGRNIAYSRATRKLISCFLGKNGKFIDYGGGTGMFVRLMRDAGFDFYWHDTYTNNQFAKGFEYNPNAKYNLLTAFEVFEHLSNPVAEIKNMATIAENILFSTELISTPPPEFSDWSYYAPFTGQHISFYTEKALHLLAKQFDLKYTRLTRTLHIFSKKTLNSVTTYMTFQTRWSQLLVPLCKGPSLLQADWQRSVQKVVAASAKKYPKTNNELDS